MNRVIAPPPGGSMKNLVTLLVLASCWMSAAGAAHACSCDPISPAAGFDRAQYVFAGKVARAEAHTWHVEVERVWKGHEKLARTVRLMDVYANDGLRVLFPAWAALSLFRDFGEGRSKRILSPAGLQLDQTLAIDGVPAQGNESLWLEDLIARDHGPGEPPRDEHR